MVDQSGDLHVLQVLPLVDLASASQISLER
jgi:hypothetical protein